MKELTEGFTYRKSRQGCAKKKRTWIKKANLGWLDQRGEYEDGQVAWETTGEAVKFKLRKGRRAWLPKGSCGAWRENDMGQRGGRPGGS